MNRQFANVPALLIDWLRTQYAARGDAVAQGVLIAAAVPPGRTADSGPLIVVRRAGGVARLVRDRARIDFLHWHGTEYDASALASITRALVLYALPGCVLGGHTVYRTVEVAGPAPYPDPAGSSLPIIMFTAEVPVRIN